MARTSGAPPFSPAPLVELVFRLAAGRFFAFKKKQQDIFGCCCIKKKLPAFGTLRPKSRIRGSRSWPKHAMSVVLGAVSAGTPEMAAPVVPFKKRVRVKSRSSPNISTPKGKESRLKFWQKMMLKTKAQHRELYLKRFVRLRRCNRVSYNVLCHNVAAPMSVPTQQMLCLSLQASPSPPCRLPSKLPIECPKHLRRKPVPLLSLRDAFVATCFALAGFLSVKRSLSQHTHTHTHHGSVPFPVRAMPHKLPKVRGFQRLRWQLSLAPYVQPSFPRFR